MRSDGGILHPSTEGVLAQIRVVPLGWRPAWILEGRDRAGFQRYIANSQSYKANAEKGARAFLDIVGTAARFPVN